MPAPAQEPALVLVGVTVQGLAQVLVLTALMILGAGGGARVPLLVRWGLIPSWVEAPASFSLLLNARSETAAPLPGNIVDQQPMRPFPSVTH